MKRKCRTHSAEFKAKVAVEAVMGKKLVTELTEQFDIHPIQIQD
jgi:transposase